MISIDMTIWVHCSNIGKIQATMSWARCPYKITGKEKVVCKEQSYPASPTLHQHTLLAKDLMPKLKRNIEERHHSVKESRDDLRDLYLMSAIEKCHTTQTRHHKSSYINKTTVVMGKCLSGSTKSVFTNYQAFQILPNIRMGISNHQYFIACFLSPSLFGELLPLLVSWNDAMLLCTF